MTCVALKTAAGAGGSLALRETAKHLSQEGSTPIVVAPPPRQWDTAAVALADVAASLSARGFVQMSIQAWLGPRTWWERIDLVQNWIAEAAESERIVLLVDDPSQWAISSSNENAWRVRSVLDVLLADSPVVPRVVVRTDGRDRSNETSVPCRHATGLLENDADWGDVLSPNRCRSAWNFAGDRNRVTGGSWTRCRTCRSHIARTCHQVLVSGHCHFSHRRRTGQSCFARPSAPTIVGGMAVVGDAPPPGS